MLQSIFSGDKPKTLIAILFFTLLLWLPVFISIENPVSPNRIQMPGYSLIQNLFSGTSNAGILIAFILLIIQSYMLFIMNGRFILMQKRTFLQSFFYLGILSFYSSIQNLSPSLCAGFFIIYALEVIFDSYSKEKNSYHFFEAGIFLGIASLFYAKSIFFLPFIWVCSLILRPFFWREWIMPVVGMLLPYIFYTAISYLIGNNPFKIFETLVFSLNTNAVDFQPGTDFYIFLGFMAVLVTISSIYMLRVFQFRKIYIRNYYLVLFWLFTFCLAIFALLGLQDAGLLNFIAIPISFILSNYFITSRKTLGNNILFTVFILLLFLNALNGIFHFVFV